MPRRSGNLSGRRCDLMQTQGVKITLRYHYMRHWDVLRDLLYRMGITEGHIGVESCHFCKSKYTTLYLACDNTEDRLILLMNHFLNHPMELIHRHQVDRMLHVLASLISCYICKGNYPHYELCKNFIRHDPFGAKNLLYGDWYGRNNSKGNYTPGNLQSFCVRMLMRPLLEDLLLEYAAYVTWYEIYRTWLKTRKQKIPRKMRKPLAHITSSLRQ